MMSSAFLHAKISSSKEGSSSGTNSRPMRRLNAGVSLVSVGVVAVVGVVVVGCGAALFAKFGGGGGFAAGYRDQ